MFSSNGWKTTIFSVAVCVCQAQQLYGAASRMRSFFIWSRLRLSTDTRPRVCFEMILGLMGRSPRCHRILPFSSVGQVRTRWDPWGSYITFRLTIDGNSGFFSKGWYPLSMTSTTRPLASVTRIGGGVVGQAWKHSPEKEINNEQYT